MNYIISEKQVKILSNYLSFKPHREVNELLYMLDQLPTMPVPKPMKEEEKQGVLIDITGSKKT